VHEDHLKRIEMIRRVRAKLNLPIAIMLDTKGPEYRIKTFVNGSVTLKDGDRFSLTTEEIVGDENRVAVTYQMLTEELQPGDTVLINNGLVILKVEEIRGRIGKTLSRYPYLVAEEEGEVLGYAYAGPFIPREAYDHCAEVSIYLNKDYRRSGLGRQLYEALFACLREMRIRNVYACIGVPEQEDAYLTDNSAGFHAHMGFREVGRFRNSGYKFGRYYHMIWMEFLLEK
jgi:phosphinothricin acetyltransferase